MNILKKSLAFGVAFFLFSGVGASFSQDVEEDSISEWRIENRLFSFEPPDGKSCKDVWDELWLKTKDGDLKSMAELGKLAFPGFPSLPQMVFPGRSGDELSAIRDALILDIHSRHTRIDGEDSDDLDGMAEEFLRSLPFGDGYIQCRETRTADHCSRAAVENVFLIPTFEEYVAEIELFLASGMKPRCTTYMKRTIERSEAKKAASPE